MNYSGQAHRSGNKAKKFFGFVLIAAGIALVLGLVVMLLWNAILPKITGVKEINFWQSLGLLALSKILFGGMRLGNWKKHKHRHRHTPWKEKWMHMSEEDKLAFKEKWKERCEKRDMRP